MSKHDWQQGQKSVEQIRRENLDSHIFADREAARIAQEERADRKLAAAAVTPAENLSLEWAERCAAAMHDEYLAGKHTPPPSEAAYMLRQMKLHGISGDAAFVKYLRTIAARVDKHELAPPAPEPYAEHAIGMHDSLASGEPQ